MIVLAEFIVSKYLLDCTTQIVTRCQAQNQIVHTTNPNPNHKGLVPTQDVHFTIILRCIAKISYF